MLTKTERLFLQAVAAAVRDREVSWQGGVAAGEWQEMFVLAGQHKLLPMVLEAVYHCTAFHSLSQQERKLYQKQAAMQVLMQTIRTQEYGNLLEFLKKEGLHPLTTAGMAIAIILLLILMQCMSKMVPGIVLSFLIVNMLLQVVQPLINSISLYYVNHGIYVDFGIGRGVGSASYAVAASFLGILIGRYYGLAIMGVGCLSFAVMFVTLISMPVVKNPNESKKEEQKNTANRQRGGGILEFARRYRNYMLVLLGMILIYVESTYVNNYLINIVVSLGGDIKRMGTLLTVSAMSELPTMLLFSRLVGKWDSRKLIRFAAVMFSVKAMGYLVCGSISFLYVVQMLQMLSFALCLPSAVYYVNETMAVEDRVKGQSLLIASSTMGGVFGSLSGGVLVDFAGIKAMLATGLGLSMIGTAIVCIFVSRKDN